jgi:hypothetical protein
VVENFNGVRCLKYLKMLSEGYADIHYADFEKILLHTIPVLIPEKA